MRFLILFSICLSACIMRTDNNTQEHALVQSGVGMGYIKDKKLDEISGMAASVSNPRCFWVHNDSGDDARIFLIDSVGRTLATVYVEGISNRDWEDVAVGPGPKDGLSYLYIANIGDNKARYKQKTVYRIEEPVLNTQQKNQRLKVSGVDEINFIYDDGARDAETLMLDPVTKDLYIVSKREDSVHVYKLPFPQSITETFMVKREMKLPFPLITGGDISADGSEILIKNYLKVYYWHRDEHESIIDALSREPNELPYIIEPQGEAISWLKDGTGYVTSSEEGYGNGRAALYLYKRK